MAYRDVSASLACLSYVDSSTQVSFPWWILWLWKVFVPLKVKLFLWLSIKDKILTWRNLQKCGFSGPSRCCLCLQACDMTAHIFGDCTFLLVVFRELFMIFNVHFS